MGNRLLFLLFFFLLFAGSAQAQLVNYEWEQILYAKFGKNKKEELAFSKSMSSSKVALEDMDNDGDYDLFVGDEDGLISYFENVGTKTNPDFTLQMQQVNARFKVQNEDEVDPLNQKSELKKIDAGSFSAPLLIDLDQDKDFDLLIGNEEGKIYQFENIGNSSDFRFDFKTDDYYKIKVGKRVVLSQINPDNDKFPDLLLGNAQGEIYIVTNTGYGTLSSFKAPPILIAKIKKGHNSTPAGIDWDLDGDMDIITGQRSGYLVYFENTGNTLNPHWDLTSDYFQGIDAGGESAPFFVDLNGDKLQDVLIGNINNYIHYYENRTYLDEKVFWSIDGNITKFRQLLISGMRGILSAADINGDGAKDIILGQKNGKLLLYLNRGIKNNIAELELYADDLFPEISVENASPEFGDLNNDGLPDILLGSSLGNLIYLRNSGTKEKPKWDLEDPNFAQIFLKGNISPRLFDVDGDDDLDLFLGVQKGEPLFYRNLGTPVEPVFIKDKFIFDVEDLNLKNAETTLAIVDWNKIGRFDLKVGDGRGEIFTITKRADEEHVNVTLSNGQKISLRIPPLRGINWEFDQKFKLVSPYFFDFDKDKHSDLFISTEKGTVLFFRQKSFSKLSDEEVLKLGKDLLEKKRKKGQKNLNPEDIVADPEFIPTDLRILPPGEKYNRPIPSFGDLDNDKDQDLLLGNHFGELLIYENQGDKFSWNFSKKPSRIKLPGKNYNTSPLLIDFDGDSDLDLIVGNEAGRIFYLENKGTKEKANFVLDFNRFRWFRSGVNSIPTVFYPNDNKTPELLVGNIHGKLSLIKLKQNKDSKSRSVREDRIVDKNFLNIDIGLASSPRFFDLNNDKVSEIILGADSGKMMVLQKNEKGAIPPWKERKDYLPKKTNLPPGVFPTVVDLDGDGDKDMVVGIDNGDLKYFRNEAFKKISTKPTKITAPLITQPVDEKTSTGNS